MRNLLLLLCFISISGKINAQTEPSAKVPLNIYNKYLIKIDSNVTINTQTTLSYIKQVCAAYSANFNSQTSNFEVYTKKELNQNVVGGKLQKNATPMSAFIYEGKVGYTASVTSNTINAQ